MPEAIYSRIGEAIRGRRESRGLTQAQLGKLTNLKRSTITNIECGRQGLLVHQLYVFAVALNTKPAELLPDAEVSGSLVTVWHDGEALALMNQLTHVLPHELPEEPR